MSRVASPFWSITRKTPPPHRVPSVSLLSRFRRSSRPGSVARVKVRSHVLLRTLRRRVGKIACTGVTDALRLRAILPTRRQAGAAPRGRSRRAVKRVIARQLDELMEEQGLTKSELAKRMRTSRAQLDRLLDPKNESVTLGTLTRAAQAVGRHLWMELV